MSEIEYAILEPIGTISVVPLRNLNPLTPRDLGLDFEYEGLPIAIVVEGAIKMMTVWKNMEVRWGR